MQFIILAQPAAHDLVEKSSLDKRSVFIRVSAFEKNLARNRFLSKPFFRIRHSFTAMTPNSRNRQSCFSAALMLLTMFGGICAPSARCAGTALSNEFVQLKLHGVGIASLRTGSKQIDFIKNLKPEFWRETSETQIKVDGTTAVKINGAALSRHFEIKAGGTAVITASELLNANKPTE